MYACFSQWRFILRRAWKLEYMYDVTTPICILYRSTTARLFLISALFAHYEEQFTVNSWNLAQKRSFQNGPIKHTVQTPFQLALPSQAHSVSAEINWAKPNRFATISLKMGSSWLMCLLLRDFVGSNISQRDRSAHPLFSRLWCCRIPVNQYSRFRESFYKLVIPFARWISHHDHYTSCRNHCSVMIMIKFKISVMLYTARKQTFVFFNNARKRFHVQSHQQCNAA